jgi:anti-sigma factor RsiW
MTCREVTEFLMRYVNGELTPAERAEFERHLAVCAACVSYLDSYRKTIDIERLVLANDRDAVECVPEELVQAILKSRKRE